MKKNLCSSLWFVGLLLLGTAGAGFAVDRTDGQCQLNGKRLYGRVRIVEHFADFRVQVVTAFPDLKVQVVTAFPDKCGKWQFVTHGEDFTIQYVTAFPDLKIKFVQAFPGQ